jgi:hypothetical protein
MPRRIYVVGRRVVDVGEAVPRRWVERIGHQAIGLGELAELRVVETRPVIPFATGRLRTRTVLLYSPSAGRPHAALGGCALKSRSVKVSGRVLCCSTQELRTQTSDNKIGVETSVAFAQPQGKSLFQMDFRTAPTGFSSLAEPIFGKFAR